MYLYIYDIHINNTRCTTISTNCNACPCNAIASSYLARENVAKILKPDPATPGASIIELGPDYRSHGKRWAALLRRGATSHEHQRRSIVA